MKNHWCKASRYLEQYGIRMNRPCRTAPTDGGERVVVIPVLAESAMGFGTLAGLSENSPNELAKTLVLCVINNRRPPHADPAEILDNRVTLTLLNGIVRGDAHPLSLPDRTRDDLARIAGSELRLGWIDASSPGWEMPEREGGVGMARKIGMDTALALLNGQPSRRGLICCLDADTLVERNYLSAVGNHFSETHDAAAVVRYAHQKPENPGLLSAICCYEIYLRSYVMGLSFAGSPYAFHAIGSTMVCTAEAYLDVRGMNRRRAAEDFHFLDKLAKIGKIGLVGTTTVFPSPRPSRRVPFGTGRRMHRFLQNGGRDEYLVYHPVIFSILREWLAVMDADPDEDPDLLLNLARKIHPELRNYLDLCRFSDRWMQVRRNCPDPLHLRHQFHVWFDGLKTLRLVHHLSRSSYPPMSMFEGLKLLLSQMGQILPSITDFHSGIPEPEMQFRILEELRSRFPES